MLHIICAWHCPKCFTNKSPYLILLTVWERHHEYFCFICRELRHVKAIKFAKSQNASEWYCWDLNPLLIIWLGGPVGEVPAFSSGHCPKVLGSCPQLGSLLFGEPVFPFPSAWYFPYLCSLSLSLTNSNQSINQSSDCGATMIILIFSYIFIFSLNENLLLLQ